MKKGDEHKEHDRDRGKHEHEGHRPRGHGRERAVFLQYLATRWKGSAPPTAEAYARALQQWRKLPGAVMTSGTDLGTIPPTPGNPPKGNGEESGS